MPKIIITDVPGLDGTYDLDMSFTHRDFHTIKQVAQVRANEVTDALQAGDVDIIVALAAIALRRAGKVYVLDQLWDATAGRIVLDMDEEEVEASPPPPSGDDGSESSESSERLTSGLSTNGATDASPETSSLADTGTPPLADTFDLPTSTI